MEDGHQRLFPECIALDCIKVIVLDANPRVKDDGHPEKTQF
jgi:hypothetical protein